MDKIYIIWDDKSSIHKCFLDKPLAENYIKNRNDWRFRLTEKEITNCDVEMKKMWYCKVWTKEPLQFEIKVKNIDIDEMEKDSGAYHDFDTWLSHRSENYKSQNICIGEIWSCVSEEHCLQLVKELYNEFVQYKEKLKKDREK